MANPAATRVQNMTRSLAPTDSPSALNARSIDGCGRVQAGGLASRCGVLVLWLTCASFPFAATDPSAGLAPRRPGPDPERVHDPSTIVTVDGVSRCFSTGPGLTLLREDASGKWLPEGRLFDEGKFPGWHQELVPGNRGHLWAPDVIRENGMFFVYYSVSTFGKNTSAIGLAVGKTLDPSATDWAWEDRGPVIVSRAGNRFNTIDPALFADPSSGSLWMVFGSYWNGIHLIELDAATGLRRDASRAPERIAWAPEIEAPFLHRRGDFYYLFLNWGKCCRGIQSTYEIRVGRSRSVAGPYMDREGADLRHGGGTLVLATEDRWIGPGHASILERNGREWLVHHYYDRDLGGRPRLRMVPIAWDADGWPATRPAAPASASRTGQPFRERRLSVDRSYRPHCVRSIEGQRGKRPVADTALVWVKLVLPALPLWFVATGAHGEDIATLVLLWRK